MPQFFVLLYLKRLESGEDLIFAQYGEEEAENVEASANVEVVGLVRVDALLSGQDLFVGRQLELAVGPNVRLQRHLQEGHATSVIRKQKYCIP